MEALRPEDPRRIGPYQMLARLGAGGMGMVFLGGSPGGRLVAVKLVFPALAEDQQFRKRFRREVAMAQAVSGAFTAPVIGADTDAPRPWLATAFLPGLSLQEAVIAYGPLPPPAVRSLAIGLAEALEAIHRTRVVHRDLKPSNIMLTPEGPRVIDFGIARAADATAVTQTADIVGSAGYIAPEQAEHGDTGPAGDVFSLGAVLTFAAVGIGPFGDGEPDALLYRVINEAPRLDAIPDPRLRDIIAACLDKDPARRPDVRRLLGWLAPEHGVLPHGTQWLPITVATDIAHRTTAPIPLPLAPRPRSGGVSRRALLVGGGIVAATAAGSTMALTLRSRNKEVPDPILWTAAGSRNRPHAGPAVIGDAVYVISDNRLYALDPATGRLRWSADEISVYGPGGDRVALTAETGVGYLIDWKRAATGPNLNRLAALDLSGGRVRWRRDVNTGAATGPPAVAAGVVCVPAATEDNTATGLFAFDARTGQSRWRYETEGTAQPAVTAAGRVFYYCAGFDAAVHAVDAATGRRRWRRALSGSAETAPVVAGGLLLAATRSHNLHAIDAAGGEPRWEVRIGGDNRMDVPAPVPANGNVYFAGNDGIVYAFDAASGSGRWRFDIGGGQGGYPGLVVAGGLLFVYNGNGRLYALDAATGNGRWQQPLDAVADARPVLAGGLLHIAAGGLISIEPATGRIVRRLTQDKEGNAMTVIDRVTAAGDTLYFHDGAGKIAAVRAR
jgi:outer membrane protein assembly factor BamB